MVSSVTDISIPDLDLMNSRPLDVQRWSEYPELNDFVKEVHLILKSIQGHEGTGEKLVKSSAARSVFSLVWWPRNEDLVQQR